MVASEEGEDSMAFTLKPNEKVSQKTGRDQLCQMLLVRGNEDYILRFSSVEIIGCFDELFQWRDRDKQAHL